MKAANRRKQAMVMPPEPEPDLSFLDAPTAIDTPPTLDPIDPARVAATCLLRRALEAAGTTWQDVGRDGSVCLVQVADAAWTILVRDEWRRAARADARHQDGMRARYHDRGRWIAWAPEEPPRSYDRSDAAEAFADAVSRGCHCLGISADTSWLPADLVDAADYRLSLPPLRSEDVTDIARTLCGNDPAERLSEDDAALLTPRLLRLARRLEQSADAYISKLRDLVQRAQTVTGSAKAASRDGSTGGSPREAPTLDRLFGMDEAVAFGRRLATDIAAFRAGTIGWSDIDRGCLLSGPPGCGKTLFARALAATCDLPLISGSYSIWMANGQAHQGDLLKGMRKAFADARAKAPSLLFIDEIDSFPNRDKVTHYPEWHVEIVNALLAEIDGVEASGGIVLLGACNNPERLDPALIRSGRLDRHIRIYRPNRTALAHILREHLGTDLQHLDLTQAAMAATGSSGADCERLVRGARQRARSAKRAVVMADLMDAINGEQARSPEDDLVSAIHEAGHVVVTAALHPGSVGVVSLVGTAENGGLTSIMMRPSAILRPALWRDWLVMNMAGRAAEEIVFGAASSGAGGSEFSDLARATALAVTALSALGLDDASGLVWRGLPESHAIPAWLAAHPKMAERVSEVLNQAYATARNLISQRVAAVEGLARALIARRVLDGAEAEAIVRQHVGEKIDCA